MRLTIVNLMQSVPMKDFMPVIGALQRQTDQDFTPEWHVPCMLRGVTDSAFMGKVRLVPTPTDSDRLRRGYAACRSGGAESGWGGLRSATVGVG